MNHPDTPKRFCLSTVRRDWVVDKGCVLIYGKSGTAKSNIGIRMLTDVVLGTDVAPNDKPKMITVVSGFDPFPILERSLGTASRPLAWKETFIKNNITLRHHYPQTPLSDSVFSHFQQDCEHHVLIEDIVPLLMHPFDGADRAIARCQEFLAEVKKRVNGVTIVTHAPTEAKGIHLADHMDFEMVLRTSRCTHHSAQNIATVAVERSKNPDLIADSLFVVV